MSGRIGVMLTSRDGALLRWTTTRTETGWRAGPARGRTPQAETQSVLFSVIDAPVGLEVAVTGDVWRELEDAAYVNQFLDLVFSAPALAEHAANLLTEGYSARTVFGR